ncbi:MAG: type II toxin-antitoxin system RelE/ParE family toxin [Bacteroidota bacterium]
MILSFRHKGLKLYYDKGDSSKLQPAHVSKIRLILTRLDACTAPGELNIPGYGLHQLSGNLKEFWSVKVSGNYRVIFRMDGKSVCEVDYLDYH